MFFADTEWQRKLARYAPLPLRLIVGYGFMAHGYAKLMKGPDAFVAIVHAMGVPEPFFMAWLTILIELLGGYRRAARRVRRAAQRADGSGAARWPRSPCICPSASPPSSCSR